MTARDDRLESWKEISAFLQRTPRTCQKWESAFRLPIHRLTRTPKARVYAFKGELDEWLERVLREEKSRDRKTRLPRDRRAREAEGTPRGSSAVSRSAVANKAYWAGRKATERFLVTRDPRELAAAIGMFERVRDEDPGNPLGFLGLGDAYRWDYAFLGMRSARLRLMTENYARAYELAPDLAETNMGLGWSRFFPGDIAAASEAFARAAALKPGDPDVDLEVANFLIGIGHLDRALLRLSRVLAGPAARSTVRWLRALCREWTGDYAGAMEDGAKALEAEPTSAYLRCQQARLSILTGDLLEAEAELSIAEMLAPKSGDIEITKALLWAARGDRRNALKALSRPARRTVLHSYIETMVHAALGDVEATVDRIARTIETGFTGLVTRAYPYPYLANPNNHFYDRLRSDPRFAGIVARQKERYDEESARLGGL